MLLAEPGVELRFVARRNREQDHEEMATAVIVSVTPELVAGKRQEREVCV
jgi:hypothetical protein